MVAGEDNEEELSLKPSSHMEKNLNSSRMCVFQVGRSVLRLGDRFLLDQGRNKGDLILVHN